MEGTLRRSDRVARNEHNNSNNAVRGSLRDAPVTAAFFMFETVFHKILIEHF